MSVVRGRPSQRSSSITSWASPHNRRCSESILASHRVASSATMASPRSTLVAMLLKVHALVSLPLVPVYAIPVQVLFVEIVA